MDDISLYYFTLNILVCSCAVYWYKYQKKKHPKPLRRFAVRPVLRSRDTHGEFANFFREIRDGDAEYFFKYTRMSCSTYNNLLDLVREKLNKKCRTCRRISAEQRLAFTLRYLSTGNSQLSCSWVYRIGRSTASNIIKETCDVLWTVLRPLVLQPPTMSEWRTIAEDFQGLWNFAHCCGAIDGKYVFMQAPGKTGSTFFCHKNMFAIILMALCDSKYRFLWVDIGAPGSESDGGVLQRSELGLALYNQMMNFPPAKTLPNSNVPFPYYFVGDEAFALSNYIMRPYPGRYLTRGKKIFNYRLSRARRTIENSFGILVVRWRIFKAPINASLETVTSITKACVCLHNYIMMSPDSKLYSPNSLKRQINSKKWREEMEVCAVRNFEPTQDDMTPSELRDRLSEYLQTQGAVGWQNKRVARGSRRHYTG